MTATNSFEPGKDGTGTAFQLTFAAESVSGNKAQKTYLGSPSTEALIEPMTLTGGTVGLVGGVATIGAVNSTSDATIAVVTAAAAPAKCQITGGIFNTSLPTLTTGQTAALQVDAAGRLIVNTVVSVSGFGLLTGSNQIGNVSITAMTLPGLTTGSNVVGTVNCSGLAGSNVPPSGNPLYIGGAYNVTQPTINSTCISPIQMTTRGAQIVATGVDVFNVAFGGGLPTGVNSIGNVSVTSITLPGLATSANNIGLVGTNADASIGAGAAPSKCQISGGVFNTVLPSPTTGQTVALQLDAAGRLICNSGAISVGGLQTGANVIGLVNTNADALIGAGTAPARVFITGGVFNTVLPTVTNGQTVGLQVDAAGRLITNSGAISLGGLQTGTNSIGNVSVTSITLPGLTTGSNVIGTVNCAGLAGSNAATSGNPLYMAGAYNATQPTINSTCIAPLQMTTRGAQIVATGVDAFNVAFGGGLPTGANLIGNVSVSTITLPGLSTGANVIGLVNSNADAAIGAGTAPSKCQIAGGVFNTALPTLTTGQTAALQQDSSGRLICNTSVTIGGLSTGANVIGAVTQSGTWNATINSGLPTGANAIGSIVGRTTSVTVTPTISVSAYTAGFECGGKMTFAVGGAGSGILESITVTSKSIQTTGLTLFLFDTNPTNSTWTDHVAPAINAADVSFARGPYTLSAASSGLGTHTVWCLDGIGMSFVGANLYGILVVTGTPTFASTSDIVVKLGIIDD